MAHNLVTQVSNPDEAGYELDEDVQYSGQQQEDESGGQSVAPVSASRWRRFWSSAWRKTKAVGKCLVSPTRWCMCCKCSCCTCCKCCRCMPCCDRDEGKSNEMVYVEPPRAMVRKLLPELQERDKGKKTLVLDLDETLVHSSFKPVPDADFIISIELDDEIHHVYVRKRPGLDEFMKAVGEKFEVVVFTASLSKYADPLLDILDPENRIRARLFREACVQHYGNYVKDLSILGRELKNTIIVDNSPFSYIFQPENAVPILSWFNDPTDRQLDELLKLLDTLVDADDVVPVLAQKNFFTQPY